jgi:hypothetical protein
MTTTTQTPDPRYCPTCLRNGTPTRMERHGRAWVCPMQRDEEKRVVSAATIARGQALAAERVAGLPF